MTDKRCMSEAAGVCDVTPGDQDALTGARRAQVLCGLLLSIVFVQSHNGMEVYSGAKDFVTAQARLRLWPSRTASW